MCGCLKPTRPGPPPAPGRLHCGYHSGKGRTVEAVAMKLFLFFEGNTSDGCSHKEEGRKKKRDKNIQKVGSIIGFASQPFFMCEHSPVKNSRSHFIPQWNSTLSPLCSSLPLCPPIHKVSEAHLTSLFNNTVHWIVTLDCIIISSWSSGTCRGNILDYYHLIMMLPRCWFRLWVQEAERQTPQ